MATKQKTEDPGTVEGTPGPEGNGEVTNPEEGTSGVTAEDTPTTGDTAPDGATTGDGSDPTTTEEKKAPARKKAPDTSKLDLDAIDTAILAPVDIIKASTPTRARSPEQAKMDAIAQRAYEAWIKANKPTLWQNMPVITYFLNEGDELEGYRYLVKHAADGVKDPKTGAPDVARIRFGNEFTVSEEMAARLKNPDGTVGRPEVAGKTVLAWAVIDKRAPKSPATKAKENREEREGKAE
jgi:hypothetical protein